MSQTTDNPAKTELAPFEILEVMLDNSTIKFFEPLVLVPTRMPHDPDEPGDVEYWDVIVPELNIDVFADNHDDLWEFVHSDIRFIWSHIVQAPDSRLDRESREIKRRWLNIAEEVLDG